MTLFRGAAYMMDGKEIEIIQYNIDVATKITGLGRYYGPTMMYFKSN
jgi:hypothetical protein